MSTTGKAVLWIIIVVVVIGGVWWWMTSRSPKKSNSVPATANSVTAGVPTSTASSSLPQGDSDQAIDQEMTDINAQMNGLSFDAANIDQSMNYQPISQAE